MSPDFSRGYVDGFGAKLRDPARLAADYLMGYADGRRDRGRIEDAHTVLMSPLPSPRRRRLGGRR